VKTKTLFTWRTERSIDGLSDLGGWPDYSCPCCAARTIYQDSGNGLEDLDPLAAATELMTREIDEFDRFWRRYCPLCGWHIESVPDVFGMEAPIIGGDSIRVLKEFNLNAAELPLAELGTHLKRSYADIYCLSWRRFEELVTDVFKTHGYDCVLTQATGDDGADILIYRRGDQSLWAVVECKKYANSRRVGVASVRQLVGAAVDWNVRRAYLVTSSEFSRIAQNKARNFLGTGYEIDLVAASELLGLLDVYNEHLPPLHLLTTEVREEIIRANSASAVA